MKFSIASLLAVLSAAPVLASCAAPEQPWWGPPTFTYLYSMNCTLAPALTIGDGPLTNRKAIPIVGGTFSGPRLSGTIANLGADWGITGKDGVFHPDTRYHLNTDDGAGIYIQTAGSAQVDGKIHLRMIFETGHANYTWLNNIVGVGILQSGGGGYVLIEAWQVESPATQ